MTNPYCECAAAGFCSRHQMKKGVREHALCKGTADLPDCGLAYWNAWELGRFKNPPQAEPLLNPEGFCDRAKFTPAAAPRKTSGKTETYQIQVGTLLEKKIIRLASIKTAEGCGCHELANEMNLGGLRWCEDNREYIISHLVKNAPMICEAVRNIGESVHPTLAKMWMHVEPLFKSLVRAIPESVVRTGAELLLESTLREARSFVDALPKPIMEPTGDQSRMFRLASASPPEPDPFTGAPVFHLGCHLYPVKGYWKWHTDLWNEAAETVSGQCFVGITTDETTDTLETVKAALSDRFVVFENANDIEGENHTFRELQKRVPSGNNDILLYCHGKGVRPHTAGSESVRLWTEMMYATVIFNHSAVIDRLNQGYKTFGSFRTFGRYHLNPRWKWHYSGTFFAVRAKHLPGKAVKHGYGGVEAWPGSYFRATDSWCEFGDNRPVMAQYLVEQMYPTVVDAQMQWEADRIGSPRCEQHLRELDWFGEQTESGDTILVIGSKHGGLERVLTEDWLCRTVSVDIDPQADNTASRMIVGSSRDHTVQRFIREAGPYDIIFIDGDHSYKGVKADWEFALTLNPRMIAFHDIAEAVKHRREGCEVDRLWAEIKATHRTGEKIVGCGWGGIGVVHL